MASKRSISESSLISSESSAKVKIIEDKHGSSGMPIKVKCNYFNVDKRPEFKLSQYRVDFEPEMDITGYRKRLLDSVRTKLPGKYIFDGATMYMVEDFDASVIETEYNGAPMKIKIKKTGTVSHYENTAFQVLNIIFRQAMSGLNLQQVRRDFFDANAKISIPRGQLELWPGYSTSIRAYEDDLFLLNAEISHKFMRNETILEIANRMVAKGGDWKDQLTKEIVGSTVLTTYSNKTFQISDIDYSMTPRSTFKIGETETTYLDYYKEKYQIEIKSQTQFMLVYSSKERDLRAGQHNLIYLIPELCRATGLTDDMRQNFQLMQEVSEFTRLNPQKRVEALLRFNKRLQSTPQSLEVLNAWKMTLSPDLMDADARELPRETIVFGNNQEEVANDKGEWMLRGGTSMFTSVPLKRWICLLPNSLKRDVDGFLVHFLAVCKDMNYEATQPKLVVLDDDSQASYLKQVREIATLKPKLILIILPTPRADRYSTVKKECLVNLGIPAQVVVKKSLTHKNVRSLASKIAVQINVKMGGIPWMIKLPVNGLMTVGFDVSLHPRDRSRSVGALVCTMDLKKHGAFYSITSEYRDGNEMNQKVAMHIEEALKIYKETCGNLPERILFYRDGVGEGQIQYVMEKEVDPLLKKLRSIYNDVEPKLCFVIVNKRINTRFFKQTGPRFANPKPGTVIDKTVTMPDRNEFFLISQHVGQGTVAPTAYNMVFNTTGLNKDKIEMLTYKFCHMYFNWSGTTRIPFVSQCAKKLAFMTSQSLQAPVHRNLERSLYFL